MFRCRLAVARQNDSAQAFIPQFLNHGGRLRADVVAQNDPAQQIVFFNPDLGEAGVGSRRPGDDVRVAAFRDPIASTERTDGAVPVCPQALPGYGFELLKFNRLQFLLLAITRDGARERMRRKPFQRKCQPRDFRFATGRKTFDLLDP